MLPDLSRGCLTVYEEYPCKSAKSAEWGVARLLTHPGIPLVPGFEPGRKMV